MTRSVSKSRVEKAKAESRDELSCHNMAFRKAKPSWI